MRRAVLLTAFFLLPALSTKAEPIAQHAIAMHGVPEYDAGFTHFDYTNENAPKGGTFKFGVTGTFDSLNPFIIRGQPALGMTSGYMALVYEPLMARCWDEPFTMYGLIAKSVEVADDRSWVVFNLDPAAHFSDGTPVTPEDVLWSWQMLRDKGRPNHRTYYKKVDKAEKTGDHSVKFTFKKNPDNGPNGSIDREMPLIIASMPVIPQHDWEVDGKTLRDFNQTSLRPPVGSGPYKIAKVDPGRSVIYTRDPAYWGKNVPAQRGMYNFDKIQVDYYRDDGVALQAFKAGQYDMRREGDINKWVSSYDFPAAHDGRVKLEELAHKRTEPASGFIFNTRRDLFKDEALRTALEYTFDFGWINRNLFHGQYRRTESFFPNSELAAPPMPEGRELSILNKFLGKLPAGILDAPVTPPSTDGSEESLRANLLKADTILKNAGYVLEGGQLYTPAHKPVTFEILLSDPVEEKIALNWVGNLKRIGINARVHTVDSAQFQARMASFDFDITTGRYVNTLSPGNEQIFFWGSAAADQQGSRNYAGVKDPVVDALATAIPSAKSRDELVATVHALDRVLMAGHYTIPFYYLGADHMAFWTRIQHPDKMPVYGTVIESWWSNPAPSKSPE